MKTKSVEFVFMIVVLLALDTVRAFESSSNIAFARRPTKACKQIILKAITDRLLNIVPTNSSTNSTTITTSKTTTYTTAKIILFNVSEAIDSVQRPILKEIGSTIGYNNSDVIYLDKDTDRFDKSLEYFYSVQLDRFMAIFVLVLGNFMVLFVFVVTSKMVRSYRSSYNVYERLRLDEIY